MSAAGSAWLSLLVCVVPRHWNMYLKSATLHVGVSHPREVLPAVLELVATKRFDPMLIEPLIGDFTDATQILLESAIKVILRRKPVAVS